MANMLIVQVLFCVMIMATQRTLANTTLDKKSYFDKHIQSQKRLSLILSYIAGGIAIIILLLGVSQSFFGVDNGTIRLIYSEISIIPLILSGISNWTLNIISRKTFRIINDFFLIFLTLISVSYLVYPFVMALFNPTYKGNITIGLMINITYTLALLVSFIYSIFLLYQLWFLNDKIVVSQTYLKNDKNKNKMNKTQLRALNKQWRMPIVFDKNRVKLIIGNEKIYDIMMNKISDVK